MGRQHKFANLKYASAEENHARQLAGQWLTRLLAWNVPMSEDLFDCLHWVINDLHVLVRSLRSDLAKKGRTGKTRQLMQFISENIESDDPYISREMWKLTTTFPSLQGRIRELVNDACLSIQEEKAYKPAEHAKEHLQELFGMSEEACRFCEFVYFLGNYKPIERYFEDELELHKPSKRELLAKLLDIHPGKIAQIIRLAGDMHILAENDFFRLESAIQPLWDDMGPDELKDLFCAPLKGDVLPLDDFQIRADELWTVRQILGTGSEMPVHVLLYGTPGTGKTTFANSLANALGLKAYAVSSRDDDEDSDRRSCLIAGANMVSRQEKAILVADEAEHLLATGGFFSDNSRDKAWINAFLEHPGRRIIWIANDIDHIHRSVLRRFTYSIQFEPLSPEQRGKTLVRILNKHHCGKRLNDQQIDELVRNHADAPVATFEMAVKQARAAWNGKKDFFRGVVSLLEASVTLSHYGTKSKKVRAVDDYDLEGACIKGSAEKLLAACRRADEAMRRGDKMRAGAATMLFYGPPGTGKTALARYLAGTIRRECVVKKASDLLGSYVGESEKAIAAMFADAEARGQVLVIDEVDSFVFSRESAHHSWEATMVNEFLTQLEECRCFCICTTNRREGLDAAAMRRFAHKEEFTYAGSRQLLALYNSLLAPLCKSGLNEEGRKRLLAMKRLAPGDFHAVQGQFGSFFGDPASVSHENMLAALEREARLKLDGSKPLGFASRI